MPSIGKIEFEERLNSKRRELEKQRSNWSDVPGDIVECITRHLNWADRIRIQAVCKAWSVVPTLHIPTIDRVPWGIRGFYWWVTESGDCQRLSGLIDPLSRQYPVELEKGCPNFFQIRTCGSAYGWVLLQVSIRQLYLYSPFTGEAIKLPRLDGCGLDQVATFSLNATSPKSVIFFFYVDHRNNNKVCIKLCSAGDYSWKTFEFDCGFNRDDEAVHAVYADGVLYCLFSQGQFCAFNVQLKEWTILATHLPPNHSYFRDAKLVVSDSDLLLWDRSRELRKFELFKFDFSRMSWVYENNLNNRVLFIGCTCFSVPAIGEMSQLANTVFDCDPEYLVSCYGSTSPSRNESLVYLKCEEATRCAAAWIQPPFGGIWRAKELINDAS